MEIWRRLLWFVAVLVACASCSSSFVESDPIGLSSEQDESDVRAGGTAVPAAQQGAAIAETDNHPDTAPAPPPTVDGAENHSIVQPPEVPVLATKEPFRAVSPIDQMLGMSADPFEVSEAYKRAYDGWTEDTTRCVRERGFTEYQESVLAAPDPLVLAGYSGLTEAASISVDGYGISASLVRLIQPAESDQGVRRNGGQRSNFAELAPTMTAAEHGALLTAVDECRTEAEQANPLPDDVPAAIYDELAAFYNEIAADAVVAGHWEEWARCLASEGFGYDSRGEVASELSAVSSSLASEIQALIASGQIGSEGSGTIREQLPIGIAERVDDLLALEASVLEADLRCESLLMTGELIQQRRFDLETEYLEENGDRLSITVAALGNEGR